MHPKRTLLAAVLPLLLLSGCRSQSQTPAETPATLPAVHSSFDSTRAFTDLTAQCAFGVRPPGSAAHEKCKAHKDRPIMGADDGASGTAALLELARVFHAKRPDVGVVLLFVDGEDWGPGENRMYLGSIFFAQNPGVYKPDYAILLDMIGQKNLVVKRELYSQNTHPELNDKVWSAAQALGDTQVFPADPNAVQCEILDDHQPFNAAGIPAIDLIDFDYPYWHTLQDTPDKCSPDSLKVIGDVLAKVIYDEK